jgi:F-type H+-transporting ATPase subunit a
MTINSDNLFAITKPVYTMWAIIVVLGILCWLSTRKMKEVPTGLQNVAEKVVEYLESFFAGIIGVKDARRYFGLFASLFIFIVACNYSSLLPGAGEVFSVPTADLSVTLGLAIVSFIMTHTIGFTRQGFGGYLKSFIKPFVIMLPFNLIDLAVRPASLALRLYGNLYGEEMVTAQLRQLFPVLLPLVMQVLSLIFCLIQAMVFTMLTAVYVQEAIGEE